MGSSQYNVVAFLSCSLLLSSVYPLPKFLMATSEMRCWSVGRDRVAELYLCIAYCNVYDSTMHNSMNSSNR